MTTASTTPEKTLGRQVSWTLPANAVYGVCNLLLLVVLNKLGSTSEVGRYSLALAITGPIFLFANLRFGTVLASDMRATVRLRDYFTLRFILLALAVVAVFVTLIVRGAVGIAPLLAVVALTKTAEAITDLCRGVQQRIERMDRIAISLVANGAAMIGSFATIYYLNGNLLWAATGLLFGRLAVLLAYDIPLARDASRQPVFVSDDATEVVTPAERRSRQIALLVSAAPLGITATLLSLTTNIPRYVIPVIFDEEMLGLFASVGIVLQAGNLVFRAVEQPALPRLAAALVQRDRKRFWKMLVSLCGAFMSIGLIAATLSLLVGGRLLSLMFTPQFATLGGVLAAMTLAAAIAQIAGMIESSLIAARVIPIQVPIHCITAATCLGLSYALIPQYGLYGAVIAVSACRFPFMIMGVLLLRRYLDDPQPTSSAGSHVNQSTNRTDQQMRAA